MPSPEKAPLAKRYSPADAKLIYDTAKELLEGGTTQRKAVLMLRLRGWIVSTNTLAVWKRRDGWKIPEEVEGNPTAVRRGSTREITERASTCKRRCQTCLKLIEPGETHICEIRAGKTIPIFGGSFL